MWKIDFHAILKVTLHWQTRTLISRVLSCTEQPHVMLKDSHRELQKQQSLNSLQQTQQHEQPALRSTRSSR